LGKIFKALEKSQANSKKEEKGEKVNETGQEETLKDYKTKEESYTIDSAIVSALKPHSVEAEQFRLLKNSILFPEKTVPPRCIMVTSSIPEEGKSFVAANLAVSIAQNIDEHVLLMDCDLRAPSIHTLFSLDNSKGLSDYLNGSEPLTSFFTTTFLDKLKVLTAGKTPLNPSELLASDQMRQLVQEVKLRYSDRYIIIDTPPPYITSETSVLSRFVDGIIIVVRQGKTKKQDVLDIINIYGREKILGVVYNYAKKRAGYGYGKYGYGKYGYGKYGYGK